MLDLRWNNIGVIGGRALLSALTRNHTLLTLSVEGSNVPKDMVEAIGTIYYIILLFRIIISEFVMTVESSHR